eukprot:2081677-Alexandrium_andersonii.AAC.1
MATPGVVKRHPELPIWSSLVHSRTPAGTQPQEGPEAPLRRGSGLVARRVGKRQMPASWLSPDCYDAA